MKTSNQTQKTVKNFANDNHTNTKMNYFKFFMIFAVLVTSFLVSVDTAQAVDWGAASEMFNNIKNFAFSGKFWINAVVISLIGIVAIILLLLRNGSLGDTEKYFLFGGIILLAIFLSTKVIDSDGDPQYLWDNDQVGKYSRFFIGPSGSSDYHRPDCPNPTHSDFLTLIGWEPNPDCCGTGAYYIHNTQERDCRQGILRTNNDGMGLPVFIITAILFILLFSASKESLGIDKMGEVGSTWFPIIVGVLLAALTANQRVTKSTVIMIGGWVAVILIGRSMSKSIGKPEDDDEGNVSPTSRGFAFGLAFAFVQTIANMLGGSLFGGWFMGIMGWAGFDTSGGAIGITTIFWNFIIGIFIGLIYGSFFGEGIFGHWLKNMRKNQRKDIKLFMEKDEPLRALGRSIPIAGEWFKSSKEDKEDRKTTQRISDVIKILRKRESELTSWSRRHAGPLSPEEQDELDQIRTDISLLERYYVKEAEPLIDDLLEDAREETS